MEKETNNINVSNTTIHGDFVGRDKVVNNNQIEAQQMSNSQKEQSVEIPEEESTKKVFSGIKAGLANSFSTLFNNPIVSFFIGFAENFSSKD